MSQQTDVNGTKYNTVDGKPPSFPQPVVVQTPNGPAPGYFNGQTANKNS